MCSKAIPTRCYGPADTHHEYIKVTDAYFFIEVEGCSLQ